MKILCVDDESRSRQAAQRLLSFWGHTVVEAASGQECLDAMREKDPPRLILLDWSLPDITGIEVARTLRSDPEVPYAYIIFITGHNTQTDKVTALDSGGDEFLIKPFDPVELQSRVRVAERLLAKIPRGWAAAPEVAGYELGELLGEGAFGVVYKAIQLGTERTVAVKLRRRPLEGQRTREAFLKEARIAAKLDHPNIVRIFDFRTQGDQDYLAMEYVDGTTLTRHLETARLTRDQVIRLMIKICDAVAYAHHQGVVHRDLKPSNIMIDRRGEPKVADFGLAKTWTAPDPDAITSPLSENIVGTPAFMSPEQARGTDAPVGPPADVYALGVTLYCLILGRYPYDGDMSSRALLDTIAEGRIVPPRDVTRRVAPRLEALMLQALARRPADRFRDAGAMAAALRRYRAPARVRPGRNKTQEARLAD